jgi:hypothetical protein
VRGSCSWLFGGGEVVGRGVVVFWVCWDWVGGGMQWVLAFMMGMCGVKGLLLAVVFGSARRWLVCEVGMIFRFLLGIIES